MAAKRSMEILANCNYAVELGKKVGFRLVNIEGNDIMTGNKTLTLGLVWQLMRQYTLSLLAKLSPDGTPIVESEILNWANQRLTDAGKDVQVKGFHVSKNKVWNFSNYKREQRLKKLENPRILKVGKLEKLRKLEESEKFDNIEEK